MSEEDLELLITTDDPGEDTLEEDTFHLQVDNMTTRRPSLNKVATRPAYRSESKSEERFRRD
jgi:hypothetical protein